MDHFGMNTCTSPANQVDATLQYARSGHTAHRLMSLIMRMSGFLQYAKHGLHLWLRMGHSGHEGKVVSWLSSWLWISRPSDWPQSSWTDRKAWMSPSSLAMVFWLLKGPSQILWWAIKPNCLYGWRARSWMTNITAPLLLHALWVLSAVWSGLECIVSPGAQLILTLSGLESVYRHCLFMCLQE